MRLALVEGRFVRRWKRFFAEVELTDGRRVVAHCPNTGSMKTLLEPGRPAFVLPSDDPRRKLAWTLVLLGVGEDGETALVDTARPNAIVAAAARAGELVEFGAHDAVRREVRYGARGSVVDLVLEHELADGRRDDVHVEVKNVTMASAAVSGRADFPDAVSTRGTRHLHDLADLARAGGRAAMLYLVSRGDCTSMGFAAGIDPVYAAAAREARDVGVAMHARRLEVVREADGVFAFGLGPACAIVWES